MMRSLSVTLALLGVLASLGALLFIRHFSDRMTTAFIEHSHQDLTVYLQAVANSKSATLFEGLPHPDSEPDLYLIESLKPETTAYRGLAESDSLHLYNSPLPIDLVESLQLISSLGDSRFVGASGSASKLCGRFHADFAVRFESQESSALFAYLCFSCNEVQFTGPYPTLKAELTPRGSEELKALLGKKRRYRPQSQNKSFFEQALEAP